MNKLNSIIEKFRVKISGLEENAMIKFLSEAAGPLAPYAYIVGGAPRDFAMGYENIKDIDVVMDSKNSGGKNAKHLAARIVKILEGELDPHFSSHLDKWADHPDPANEDRPHSKIPIMNDKFGVVHFFIPFDFYYDGVNLKNQKIEIVTARKEKYDKGLGTQSHKPSGVEPGTIHDDLLRRDFNFNTLVWNLLSVAQGPDKSQIQDILGKGMADLKNKRIQTPLDPQETFSDDPSRMLRAIRFAIKYNFDIPPDMKSAIKNMKSEIRRMDAFTIGDILFSKILTLPGAMKAIKLMAGLGLLQEIVSHIMNQKGGDTYIQSMVKNHNIEDINLVLQLAGFGMKGLGLEGVPSNFIRKIRNEIKKGMSPATARKWIEDYKRPPVNMPKLIKETGFKKDEIKRITDFARALLTENNTITPAEMEKQILDNFRI